MGYVRNIFQCDQLLNTIYGGYPDITISTRVGSFANQVTINPRPITLNKFYWKLTDKVIDWAWETSDGPSHCLVAYLDDPDEDYNSNNWWFFLLIIPLFIISVSSWLEPICVYLSFFMDFHYAIWK